MLESMQKIVFPNHCSISKKEKTKKRGFFGVFKRQLQSASF
jgi:hypothetical protein